MVNVLLWRGCAVRHLAARFGAPALAFLLFQNADGDAIRGNHLSEPGGIVFGPSVQRNKQNLALETYPPMQVASVITEFDRVADGARLEAHPTFGARANHDRTLGINQQNSPVEKFFIARQGNRKLLAPARHSQQSAPRQIGNWDIDEVDRSVMLEAMNLLRVSGLHTAAQDMIDAQHRAWPFPRRAIALSRVRAGFAPARKLALS